MSTVRSPAICLDQLIEGFGYCVGNAIRTLQAAHTLIEADFPDKSIALAQVGQEEVGKSLILLAACHLSPSSNEWHWFWKDWKNHNVKSHRAYLYEHIHPIRIELNSPEGKSYSGLPQREPISREKEAGLYVDLDTTAGEFRNPSQQVSQFEAVARVTTLLYLSLIADAVKRTLLESEPEKRFAAFGGIALKLCKERVYQQDMPEMLRIFQEQSPLHRDLIRDLKVALGGLNSALEQATGKPITRRGN